MLQGRLVAERIVERSPGERPDAIFAANDLVAVGVLQAVTMLRSVRVPEEIALVGYDDIAFARSTVVPLTSIRQPSEELGRRAIDLLLGEPDVLGPEVQREPQHVVFQPELVVRASTTGP